MRSKYLNWAHLLLSKGKYQYSFIAENESEYQAFEETPFIATSQLRSVQTRIYFDLGTSSTATSMVGQSDDLSYSSELDSQYQMVNTSIRPSSVSEQWTSTFQTLHRPSLEIFVESNPSCENRTSTTLPLTHAVQSSGITPLPPSSRITKQPVKLTPGKDN